MVIKRVYQIDGRVVTEMENGTADAQQFLRADWQAEVDAGTTTLGYDDWFAQQFSTDDE
jgi:hypothetical protein